MVPRPYRLFICFILPCLVSSCATWSQHGVTVDHKKIRIAVLPIEVTADITNASDITSTTVDVSDEKQFVQEQMQTVGTQLAFTLNAQLNESSYFETVPVDSSKTNISTDPQTWTIEELNKLKDDHGIQAILLVKLAGYGKLKKKWLTYLIGSGVVEGVVQGILAAKVVNNTWVGVAIAAEEIGQELLVWGGGSYLFNKHYAPVTFEAQLISTTDSKVIWDDLVFVSVDTKAIEALPKEDQNKKEIQLNLTAKKALDELTDDLDKKAKRNLK